MARQLYQDYGRKERETTLAAGYPISIARMCESANGRSGNIQDTLQAKLEPESDSRFYV